jgi:hypothetical protein
MPTRLLLAIILVPLFIYRGCALFRSIVRVDASFSSCGSGNVIISWQGMQGLARTTHDRLASAFSSTRRRILSSRILPAVPEAAMVAAGGEQGDDGIIAAGPPPPSEDGNNNDDDVDDDLRGPSTLDGRSHLSPAGGANSAAAASTNQHRPRTPATAAAAVHSATSATTTTAHLVLHFDINETILIGDDAGGDTRQDCLNKILAKSAYVQIPANNDKNGGGDDGQTAATNKIVPTHWWDGTPIREKYESLRDDVDDDTSTENDDGRSSGSSGRAPPPPLYTGWDWPTQCCPYYRTAYKARSRDFVSHHGSCYRDVYEHLLGAVGARGALAGTATLPSTAAAGAAATTPTSFTAGIHSDAADEANKDDDDVLLHMIPAFFETLQALSAPIASTASCDDSMDLMSSMSVTTTTIVLRTFGSDLLDISDAVTRFARGEHPDYPEYCNPDYAIPPENLVQGRWMRRAGSQNSNTHKRSKGSCGNDDDHHYRHEGDEKDDFVYELWQNGRVIASGDGDVLEWIHSKTACGIQDDYDHWNAHDFAPWAGKPVWVPMQHPTTQEEGDQGMNLHQHYHHHILLDDNMYVFNKRKKRINFLAYFSSLFIVVCVSVLLSLFLLGLDGRRRHNLVHDSIASVRVEREHGKFYPLSGAQILQQQGLHLIRVPTIEPMFDTRWFLQQISRAQERFNGEQQRTYSSTYSTKV